VISRDSQKTETEVFTDAAVLRQTLFIYGSGQSIQQVDRFFRPPFVDSQRTGRRPPASLTLPRSIRGFGLKLPEYCQLVE
jgi:hypothetical protein